MKNMVVKQVPEKEVPVEVLATSIVAIAEGFKKLRAGRLNDKALVLLLAQASGVGKREVENVVWALDNLGETYLKKAVKT